MDWKKLISLYYVKKWAPLLGTPWAVFIAPMVMLGVLGPLRWTGLMRGEQLAALLSHPAFPLVLFALTLAGLALATHSVQESNRKAEQQAAESEARVHKLVKACVRSYELARLYSEVVRAEEQAPRLERYCLEALTKTGREYQFEHHYQEWIECCDHIDRRIHELVQSHPAGRIALTQRDYFARADGDEACATEEIKAKYRGFVKERDAWHARLRKGKTAVLDAMSAKLPVAEDAS